MLDQLQTKEVLGLCCILWLFGLAVFLFHIGFAVPLILRRWAEVNGHEIIRKERWWFFRAPHYETALWIVLRDRNDDLKAGWVRIGRYWNPYSNRIEIRWDDRRI